MQKKRLIDSWLQDGMENHLVANEKKSIYIIKLTKLLRKMQGKQTKGHDLSLGKVFLIEADQ